MGGKKKSTSLATLKAAMTELEEQNRRLEQSLEAETARCKVATNLVTVLRRKLMEYETSPSLDKSKAEDDSRAHKIIASVGGDGHDAMDAIASPAENAMMPQSNDNGARGGLLGVQTHSTETSIANPSPIVVESVVASAENRLGSAETLRSLEATVASLTAKCEALGAQEHRLRTELEAQTSRLFHANGLVQERERQLSNALGEVERLRELLEEKLVSAYSVEERARELQAEAQEKEEIVNAQRRSLIGLETKMVKLVKRRSSWSLLPTGDKDFFERSHWVPDRERPICGEVFCSKHLSKTAKLSVVDYSYMPDGIQTKVCDSCYEQTQGLHC
ncbi:hypothetical protein HDU96_010818 [Phlyctochytrium bullatum]|nr:hypothetical protein HDU96_010818 [Phlyctochytrium bullatum]